LTETPEGDFVSPRVTEEATQVVFNGFLDFGDGESQEVGVTSYAMAVLSNGSAAPNVQGPFFNVDFESGALFWDLRQEFRSESLSQLFTPRP